MDSTTLDRFGRVLLPKEVRDRLGIGPGDPLDLSVEGGSIVLRRHPLERPGVAVREGVPVFTGRTPDGPMDVVDLLRRIREERDRRVGGMGGE